MFRSRCGCRIKLLPSTEIQTQPPSKFRASNSKPLQPHRGTFWPSVQPTFFLHSSNPFLRTKGNKVSQGESSTTDLAASSVDLQFTISKPNQFMRIKWCSSDICQSIQNGYGSLGVQHTYWFCSHASWIMELHFWRDPYTSSSVRHHLHTISKYIVCADDVRA